MERLLLNLKYVWIPSFFLGKATLTDSLPSLYRNYHLDIEKAPSNNLTVQLCNVRSLFNKLNLIKLHFSTNNSIGMFFLTETWLCDKISDSMLSINNFSILRSDRQHSIGGGVALIYKNVLKVKQLIVDVDRYSADIDNFEFLGIDYFVGSLRIRMLCFYLPPAFSSCLSTVKTVCKLIEQLSDPFVPCFVLGDFNLPNIDWKVYSSTGGPSHNHFLDFCNCNTWS